VPPAEGGGMEIIMTLQQRVDNTLNAIEQYCSLLLLNQEYAAKKYIPLLVDNLSNLLPEIIKEYEKDYLLEKKEEQQYWIDQIRRITESIDKKDYFYQIDVLMNETAENIKYFCTLIK